MINVGIVGATGYTGAELVRLLLMHPEVNIQVITSRTEQDRAVSEIFPALRNHTSLRFSAPDTDLLVSCDLVFFATPHTVAMQQVSALLENSIRVIDLSADFRLTDPDIWSRWYGEKHAAPELLSQAVYGLPEINRERIGGADLVANPGCYPTAIILGLLPVIENGIVELNNIIADAKSGVSGAGRKAQLSTQYCEVSESFRAYSVTGHRHLPEIIQGLNMLSPESVNITFIPHLIPMIRGIFATIYARVKDEGTDIQELYLSRYLDEPFVDVMEKNSHPDTYSVRGTNTCRIALHNLQHNQTLVVLSVIDNLVKGAAGQAIQNMNIMFGFDEKSGLDTLPLLG